MLQFLFECFIHYKPYSKASFIQMSVVGTASVSFLWKLSHAALKNVRLKINGNFFGPINVSHFLISHDLCLNDIVAETFSEKKQQNKSVDTVLAPVIKETQGKFGHYPKGLLSTRVLCKENVSWCFVFHHFLYVFNSCS